MYVLVYNTILRLCQLFCCSGKANLVWFTLFYSSLLALTDGQTDRQTDREMNILALRGLKEPFFISSCAVVSVFCSGRKQVCTQEYNKVVVLCLVFLVLAGNSFWCFVHMVLIVQYSCAVVSVFGSGGKSVLVLHTYLLRVQYNCGVVLVFWS